MDQWLNSDDMQPDPPMTATERRASVSVNVSRQLRENGPPREPMNYCPLAAMTWWAKPKRATSRRLQKYVDVERIGARCMARKNGCTFDIARPGGQVIWLMSICTNALLSYGRRLCRPMEIDCGGRPYTHAMEARQCCRAVSLSIDTAGRQEGRPAVEIASHQLLYLWRRHALPEGKLGSLLREAKHAVLPSCASFTRRWRRSTRKYCCCASA